MIVHLVSLCHLYKTCQDVGKMFRYRGSCCNTFLINQTLFLHPHFSHRISRQLTIYYNFTNKNIPILTVYYLKINHSLKILLIRISKRKTDFQIRKCIHKNKINKVNLDHDGEQQYMFLASNVQISICEVRLLSQYACSQIHLLFSLRNITI